MTRKLRVGVVGGGIGGAAVTSALAQQGFEVRTFERTSAFGEIGAGIQVTPNAVKVLEALGLGEALRKVAFLPQAIVGRNWDTAKEIFRIPLADETPRLYNAPFFHVHRADLHQLLVESMPQGVATLSAACIDIRQEKDSAVAIFEDGSEFEADLIVGADGVRSTVRNKLFGDDAPKFTGNMCFRAVVPVDGSFDFVSPDSSFWLGPKSHIVTYYVRRGQAVNIVAVNETADWVEESWNAPSSREELLAAFAGWHPNIIQLFERVDSVFKWGLFDRDPMTTWSKGRITLLGDACHPMLPFLSQGAAMAIEDGYVLARSLAAHGSDISAALRDYEAERIPRTSRVQLESRERGRTYHLPSVFAQRKRDLIYQFKSWINPHTSGIQTDWVYAYNAVDFQPRIAAAV
jgi:salicylate hydroxylase